MKSILKIYRRYIVTAVLLVAFVVVINVAIFLAYTAYVYSMRHEASDGWARRLGGYQSIADNLLPVPEAEGSLAYSMQDEGYALLEERGYAFALLLDGQGDVVWEWQRPEEIPTHFSPGQIAAFSKWYLQDYPIREWRYGEEGLLVLAQPKGSAIRYNPSWQPEEVTEWGLYAGVFFLCNALLVFVLALVFGYRFYRSLKPVGQGIDALAAGESVVLPERGLTQYLREKINQTSRLLEGQRQALEKRDGARTEWIAGVSHDIRTPLALIVGYAATLESDDDLPAYARDGAAQIRKQSFRIKKLIEDLNLTSRLTYQTQPLRQEDYVPAAWLRRAVADLINSGEVPDPADLEVEVDPALETCHMSGDVQLLTRALSNLIGNSVRHNPGGCRIRLCAKETEEGFCFCVEDDGMGVPREVQDVLRREESDPPGMHVMGLRVVDRIARSHGGTLWFEKDGRAVWVSVKGKQESPEAARTERV